MKYALQLYSVRDCISSGEDLLKVLEQVKAMGYEGVEFAGFFGLSAEVIRQKLDELGLCCVGAHMSVESFEGEMLAETLKTAKTLGTGQIGVGGGTTSPEKALQKLLDTFANAARLAAEQGITVYFHNHTSEFKPPRCSKNKTPIFERLMEVCSVQLDTYWSYHAGIDTPAYIELHKDKIVTLHIKDGIKGKPTALGEGDNDIAAILKAGDKAGIEWAIVENDEPVPTGLEDVARSMAYLKSL